MDLAFRYRELFWPERSDFVPADRTWADRGSGQIWIFHGALNIQAFQENCFPNEAKFQIEFDSERPCILPWRAISCGISLEAPTLLVHAQSCGLIGDPL
jgi:hypothetical protein